MTSRFKFCVVPAALSVLLSPLVASAEISLRKIGELDIPFFGVAAGLDPVAPVVPKGIASGVRVVVNVGGRNLTVPQIKALFRETPGAPIGVEGVLSGAGLSAPLTLAGTAATTEEDAFLLPLPPFERAGDYTLTHVRVVKAGVPLVDAQPRTTTVKVIDQVLVTSVTTRPLTLKELQDRGIVLDSSSYTGFEFNLAMQVESKPVNFSFPVAFDSHGVPVPMPLRPPPAPSDRGISLPTIQAMMLEIPPSGGGGGGGPNLPPRMPNGDPVRIPAIIVFPGEVGFLLQHFSAMLYVANGAPGGSNLIVKDVTGKIHLPPGRDLKLGTDDDPLTIARREDGTQPDTLPVKGVGPDGIPDTEDDPAELAPAEQGQAEFVVRGEKEGFHTVNFDVAATLEGLPVGPVTVRGKATGGVLVRNAFFDLAFTLPSVVRDEEPFSMFVTVTNISRSPGNKVTVRITEAGLAKVLFGTKDDGKAEDGVRVIETLLPNESETLEYFFVADATGQVVASYIDLVDEANSSGRLNFKLGVGERGIALSPDTLVLPSAVDSLPPPVVRAAMRVLGQAWSIAGAPAGTLPRGVIRTNKNVVTQKALALAEAGLRVTLGQDQRAAVRDLLLDFWGPTPLDPGFDQLLTTTDAGRRLAQAIGAAVVDARDALAYESELAQIAAAGSEFMSFAVAGDGNVRLADGAGRQAPYVTGGPKPIPGAVLARRGTSTIGLVTAPTSYPYTLRPGVAGAGAVTFVGPDNVPQRAQWDCPAAPEVVIDPSVSPPVVARVDGGTCPVTPSTVNRIGPALVSATIVGPETLAGAGPYGFHIAFLYDRLVAGESAAITSLYQFQDNQLLSAKRQLSGRLVFGNLAQPEHTYIPRTVVVGAVTDRHGTAGRTVEVPIGSNLEAPGAVVSGRVMQADGTAVRTGTIIYANTVPGSDGAGGISCSNAQQLGFAEVPLINDGRFEFRYVRQAECGPWSMKAKDPVTGALRSVSGNTRVGGEHHVLDIVLLGRGAVEGIVRQGTQPVGGAHVTAYSVDDSQSGGRTVTDGNGYYRIDGITVGPVTVVAGIDKISGSTSGRIERAGTTAKVDVTLIGLGVKVSGKVTQLEEGKPPAPASEALVAYFRRVPWDPYVIALGYKFTGEDGTYKLEDMPSGDYLVRARLKTGESQDLPGTAQPGQDLSPLDFAVAIPPPTSLGTVSGRVVFPNGDPAPDVIVSLENGRGVLTGKGTAVDGREIGTFVLPGLEIASGVSRTLSAQSRDGKRRGTVTFVMDRPLLPNVTIPISGLGIAQFKMLGGADGKTPVPGVDVGLGGACQNTCGCQWVTTDANGVAEFKDLPLGTVTAKAFEVRNGGVDVAVGQVTLVRDGEPVLGTMSFPGLGAVHGTVYCPTTRCEPEGGPAKGAEVTLYARRFDSALCSILPSKSQTARAADGTYRFEGVNVGPVTVAASFFVALGPGSANGSLVRDGQELPLDVHLVDSVSRQLVGTIYMPDGETPAGRGVDVTAKGPTPEIVVKTLDDGSYEFAKVLTAGYYTVTATDPTTGLTARTTVYLPKTTGSDEEPLRFDIRLKGRGTVRVSVKTDDGAKVESALVKLYETEYPDKVFEAALDPSDDGVVVFDRVDEGRFSVTASDVNARGGRVSGAVAGPGAETEVTVRLTATGTVKGTFLLPGAAGQDPTPIAFGTVRLTAAGRVIGQVTTGGSGDATGTFSFDYVPAGTFRLDAQDPLTGRTGFAPGEIKNEKDTVVVNVTALGLGTVRGKVTQNGQDFVGQVYIELVSGSYRAKTLVTDGRYELPGVPEGKVTVTASLGLTGSYRGSATGDLAGQGGMLDLDVALQSVGIVRGYVQRNPEDGSTDRHPVSLVTITSGPGYGLEAFSRVEDGLFEIRQVPAGKATLTADVLTSPDRGVTSVVVPEGGEADGSITLNGIGSLRVRGFHEGQPVDGELVLQGTGAFPYWLNRRISDLTDGLVVPDLFAGPATLRFTYTPPGGLPHYGTVPVDVIAGQEISVAINTQPSGRIWGRVFRDSTATPVPPAWGAEIRVTSASLPGTVGKAQAGQDGAFELPGYPLPLEEPQERIVDVEIVDELTSGRALFKGLKLTKAGLSLGDIALDATPPTLTISQPDGQPRIALAGSIDVEMFDKPGGSGVDPSTFALTYPRGGSAGIGSFGFDGRRLTGVLPAQNVNVGPNRLVVTVKDKVGHTGQAFVDWIAAGATLTVTVRRGGVAVAGAKVTVGGVDAPNTDAAGVTQKPGLRPGAADVVVTDPESSLKFTYRVTVVDGQDLALDVPLPAFRRVVALISHKKDGAPASGCAGTLTVVNATVTTSDAGRADFGVVPAGEYSIDVTCPSNGDRGRSLPFRIDDQSPSVVEVPIKLNGVGRVIVTVKTAAGALVDNASVVLTSSSPFARPLTAPTVNGVAEFPHVLAGTLAATATASGLGGKGWGTVADGQTDAAILIQLEPVRVIEGTVYEAGGQTAAGAGLTVSLTGSKIDSKTTDETGRFRFEGVPFGSFTVTVTTPRGDRGQTSGTLGEGEGPHTANVTLTGFGAVTVNVKTGGGDPVTGADVTVSSGPPWSRASYGPRATVAGSVTFDEVLAGAVFVRADKDGLFAFGNGTLAAGGSITVDVSLQATGTLQGIVLRPDGQQPFEGAKVLFGAGSYTTGADGRFVFEEVKLGTYTLDVYVGPRLRARVTNVKLTSHGQVETREITLVGVGTVTGVVTEPASTTPAANATVTIDQVFGGALPSVITGTDGRYTIPNVPVGAFHVVAQRTGLKQSVDATGVVQFDGQSVTLDLKLLDNVVPVDGTLLDANGLAWLIAKDGSVAQGMLANAPALSLVLGGQTLPFTGVTTSHVATEEAKRELIFPQDLGGLRVTRKTYVPADGYFLRFLDVLENPTGAEVRVSVVESWSLRPQWTGIGVVDSSSGDAVAGSGDHWVSFDDGDARDIYLAGGFLTHHFAPMAIVSSGAGGPAPPAVSLVPGLNPPRASYRWDDVVIPAGGRVAFLSLMSAQADRTRVRAAAERLVQLPPEAIQGLSSEEAQAIRNFAVPEDLMSAVAPLPPLDGVVTGRILGGDRETPAVPASVTFRSRSPYYGRPLSTTTHPFLADGAFAFRPSTFAYIPRAPYDLEATANVGIAVKATASGDFATDGVRDLAGLPGVTVTASSNFNAFWNAPYAVDGVLSPGTWVSSTTDTLPVLEIVLPVTASLHEIRLRGPRDGNFCGNCGIQRAQIEILAGDGTLLFTLPEVNLPPYVAGTSYPDADVLVSPPVAGRRIRITARARYSLAALAEVQVMGEAPAAGPSKASLQDVVFAGYGVVAGQVRRSDGSVVTNTDVKLTNGTHSLSLWSTDASGRFVFPVVPPGTYDLSARMRSNFATTHTVPGVVVPADTRTDQDVVFPPLGQLDVTTLHASSQSGQAQAAQVTIAGPVTATVFTDANTGFVSVKDLTPGTYQVTATDHRRSGVVLASSLAVNAGTNTASFTFPPWAPSVPVLVREGGTPKSGIRVCAEVELKPLPLPCATTGTDGKATLLNLAGRFTARAQNSDGSRIYGTASAAIVSEGQPPAQLTTIDYAGRGTVAGAIQTRDGAGAAATTIRLLPADASQHVASSAFHFNFSFADVPFGSFKVRAERLGSGSSDEWETGETDVSLSSVGQSPSPLAVTLSTGTLAAGQRHLWEILLRPEQPVTMFARASGSSIDPYLELYAPDGTLVAANDNISPTDKGARIENFTAPETATYVVSVRSVGSAAGAYTLRLRGNGAASGPKTDTAFRRITAHASVQGRVTRQGPPSAPPSSGPALTVSAVAVAPATPITVSWSGIASPTRWDWIGFYAQGASDFNRLDFLYASSCTQSAGPTALASGSCVFTMPGTAGTYELRLFANNGYTRYATSPSVSVSTAHAVAGETVYLRYDRGGVSGTATAVTAADGTYLGTVVPDQALLTAELRTPSGRRLVSKSGTTGAVDTVLDLSMIRPGLGRVDVAATCDGAPCEGVTVSLSSDNAVADAGLKTRTETASLGTTSFTEVPTGTIAVTATHPVLGAQTKSAALNSDGGVLGFTFAFVQPSAAISGTVFDGNAGVGGATVEAWASGALVAQRTTSGTGAYRIDALMPGTYEVFARLGARVSPRRTVAVSDNGEAIADLYLPTGRLEGHVVDGGAPVASAFVVLDGNVSQPLAVDAAGAFAWPAAPTGTHSLYAYDGARRTVDTTVDVVSDQTAHVTLDFAATRLRVVVLDGEVAVSDPQVRVIAPDGTSSMRECDGCQSLDFHDLVAGREYGVVAWSRSRNRPVRTSVTLVAGQVSTLTLRLADQVGTVIVEGIVESSGAPAVGATVQLYSGPDEWRRVWSLAGRLDGAGRATFLGIPAGELIVNGAEPYGLGEQYGMLVAGGTTTLRVRFGQRQSVPIQLHESDLVKWWVGGQGEATAVRDSCRPFCGTFAAVARGVQSDGSDREWFPWTGIGRILPGGSEVEIGPRDTKSGLSVKRRVFVPWEGGYIRQLDVIHNPTGTAIETDYYLEMEHETDATAWSIDSTASGDLTYDGLDDYVVASAPDGSTYLALVTHGLNAGGRNSRADFESGPFGTYWTWYGPTWDRLRVEPNQTVILMHFVASGDVLGDVRVKAEQLRQLLPTDALQGLTAAEKAQILNFQVNP